MPMIFKMFLKKILVVFRIRKWAQMKMIRPKFKSCPKSVSFGTIGMIHCPWCISIGENSGFGNELYLTAWDSYFCKITPPCKIKLNLTQMVCTYSPSTPN